MNATPATLDFPALAPGFAARFALIIASLVALIARAFLRDPRLSPLILPLCRRLNRTTRHLAALMALLAAGRLLRLPRPGKPGGRAPKPPIPGTHAWLVGILGHEAAGYASQLSHLLAEPGVPEFLAASPTARRLLRPLCRMLGLTPAALCAVGRDRCAPSRTENATLPDTPPSAAPSQGASRQPTPAPVAAPSLPPPCPHVGWPWFPHRYAKPA